MKTLPRAFAKALSPITDCLRWTRGRFSPMRLLALAYLAVTVAVGVAVGPLVVAHASLLLSLVLWWVFVSLYFFGSSWNSTETGKAIMRQGFFLAMLITLSVLPDGLGFGVGVGEWITLVVLSCLPMLAVNMIVLVRQAQKGRSSEML